MSQLHVYFLLRNQQGFQRLLDGTRGQSSAAAPSTSGGKSWKKRSPLSSGPPLDVNARDSMGRTVLHLAAAAPEAAATEYVRLLLAHPKINVNLPDKESHWTALHRAMYHGNLASAILLLQSADIDTSLRDSEGYTAFDLYNSTLEGTNPTSDNTTIAELSTWGANRNAALGLGDGDDRLHPEQVLIRAADVPQTEPVDVRFSPVHVKEVAMSKLHTAVVTSENGGNLRICGFGSGGRLGPGQHTQYNLVPLPQLTHTIVSVALGQDHTLAVTKAGEVLSWGLNRFSQLGYVVDPPANAIGRTEEPIQATARKVTGPLKNKFVTGVAACKTASACWTDDEVFTWGTNNGQLGYDKLAHPVQVMPRVVTKISQPVLSVCITDSALACLLNTNDVVCLWNDGHFKVNFPAHAFPSEIAVYRPPQATNNTSIKKITSCDNLFAALSSNGELFTFTVPSPSESAGSTSSKPRAAIVPQRVWALRKKFSAVRDVALGADGSIIICTESGHVFVRARNAKAAHGQGAGAKTFKFQQVPYIQRVVRVCANVTGAYGALRVDYRPQPIKVTGNLIAQDLAQIQPYMQHAIRLSGGMDAKDSHLPTSDIAETESDDEGEDLTIQKDMKQIKQLCGLLGHIRESRKVDDAEGIPYEPQMIHGADLLVEVQSTFEFPAHRVIIAARCAELEQLLAGRSAIQDHKSNFVVQSLPAKVNSKQKRIGFFGCQPLSVLLLLVYLYSDDVPAVWDPRVGRALEQHLFRVEANPGQIKSELQMFARVLHLPALATSVEPPVKRMPVPSMPVDMYRLFEGSQSRGAVLMSSEGASIDRDPLTPDVVLRLADKDVFTHSTILRARSPFFAAFFDDADWTAKRWNAQGTIVVDLQHIKWREMRFVTRFMCCGGDREMFDVLDDVHSVDELLDFMLDVMAVANELHIDRLILLCSSVILERVNINNVYSVLSDASYLHAAALVRALHDYMAANMETLLESHMLDELGTHLVRQLSTFVRQRQLDKYPTSRSNELVDKAMELHREWLKMQDIPQPFIPGNRFGEIKDSPKLSPPGPMRTYRVQPGPTSSPASPVIRPVTSTQPAQTLPTDDEVFVMDDPAAPVIPVKAANAKVDDSSIGALGGWKPIMPAPRVDMRSIMAEAQTPATPKKYVPPTVPRVPSGNIGAPQYGPPPRTIVSPGMTRNPSDPPWRQSPVQSASIKPPSGSPITSTLSVGKRVEGTSNSASGPPLETPRPHQQTRSPKKALGLPGMGPVFTPSKQAGVSKGSPSSIRRVSSGSVWTLPPVQPVVQSSSSGAALSFAAIQQAQLEQDATPAKDKRSLIQIQEEERARQVEEDFLKWWAAEEARLQAEEQGPVHPAERPKKTRKAKGAKGTDSPVANESRSSAAKGKKSRGRPSKGSPPSNAAIRI